MNEIMIAVAVAGGLALAGAIAGVLYPRYRRWLGARAGGLVLEINDAVADAVVDAYRQVVRPAKAALEDGKVSAEELERLKLEARDQVVGAVVQQLGVRAIERAAGGLAVDTYLGRKVDATVHRSKRIGQALGAGAPGKLLSLTVDGAAEEAAENPT